MAKAKASSKLAPSPDGREESLRMAISQIEKSFGEGSIMRLGDEKVDMNIDVIPTGSLSLDVALGIGGVPKGRIIEIYGPESSGKTTLALHIIAEAQKTGGVAAFVDAEHALDPIYARNLGVNIEELYVSQPDDGEQALEIAETMIRSGAIDVVVVDSVAALVPRAEIEGEMHEANVGLQARLMSKALRKLASVTSKSNCTVIFINQLRSKIGVLYGNPETTTGGVALKYAASIRIDIRRSEQIKSGADAIGNRTKIKIVKNKVAPPFKSVEVDIMYGKGISHTGDVLDLAAEIDVVHKGGAWYSYNETRIGQGRENAKKFLDDNPEMALDIENRVREHYALEPLKYTNKNKLEIKEEYLHDDK